GARSGADPAADVGAADGVAAPLRLGVGAAAARAVRLLRLASFLPDRDRGGGAGRLDGTEADSPAGAETVAARSRLVIAQGGAGASRPGAGGQDRFDRGRGGRALPDRRRPGRGRGGAA